MAELWEVAVFLCGYFCSYFSISAKELQFLLTMPHCRVYNCNGHSGMKGLSLLCFPKDVQLAQRWLVLCRCELGVNVDKYKIKSDDRVCSRHFCEDDFQFSKQNTVLMSMGQLKKTPKKMLKPDVVPHLNMPRVDSSTPRSTTHLAKKQADEEKQERKRVSLLQFYKSSFSYKTLYPALGTNVVSSLWLHWSPVLLYVYFSI